MATEVAVMDTQSVTSTKFSVGSQPEVGADAELQDGLDKSCEAENRTSASDKANKPTVALLENEGGKQIIAEEVEEEEEAMEQGAPEDPVPSPQPADEQQSTGERLCGMCV